MPRHRGPGSLPIRMSALLLVVLATVCAGGRGCGGGGGVANLFLVALRAGRFLRLDASTLQIPDLGLTPGDYVVPGATIVEVDPETGVATRVVFPGGASFPFTNQLLAVDPAAIPPLMPRNAALLFEFSTDVNPSSVDSFSVQVRVGPSPSPFVPGLLSVSGRYVIFTPTVTDPKGPPADPRGYPALETIEVRLPATGPRVVQSAAGSPLTVPGGGTAKVVTFAVRGPADPYRGFLADTDPPGIDAPGGALHIEFDPPPAPGSHADETTALRFFFDEAIEARSLSLAVTLDPLLACGFGSNEGGVAVQLDAPGPQDPDPCGWVPGTVRAEPGSGNRVFRFQPLAATGYGATAGAARIRVRLDDPLTPAVEGVRDLAGNGIPGPPGGGVVEASFVSDPHFQGHQALGIVQVFDDVTPVQLAGPNAPTLLPFYGDCAPDCLHEFQPCSPQPCVANPSSGWTGGESTQAAHDARALRAPPPATRTAYVDDQTQPADTKDWFTMGWQVPLTPFGGRYQHVYRAADLGMDLTGTILEDITGMWWATKPAAVPPNDLPQADFFPDVGIRMSHTAVAPDYAAAPQTGTPLKPTTGLATQFGANPIAGGGSVFVVPQGTSYTIDPLDSCGQGQVPGPSGCRVLLPSKSQRNVTFVRWPDFVSDFPFRPIDPADPGSGVRNLLVDFGIRGQDPPVTVGSNGVVASAPFTTQDSQNNTVPLSTPTGPFTWITEAGGFDAVGNTVILDQDPFSFGSAGGFPNDNPCGGQNPGPLCGAPGDASVLWARFDFSRRVFVVLSPFFDVALQPGGSVTTVPDYVQLMTTPDLSTLPSGSVRVEFRGSVTGPDYFQDPQFAADATSWTTSLQSLDGFPFLQLRLTLSVDPVTGEVPLVDDLRVVLVDAAP